MKHIQTIARKPEMAQSSLAIKMNFLVQLTDRIVRFIMQSGDGGL